MPRFDHLEDRPELFYHKVTSVDLVEAMEEIRCFYLDLANQLCARLPHNRSRSLALTYLEDSLMRAIQSLAILGEKQEPGTSDRYA